ncbi:MAG: hypothetical protein U9P49_09020 [Thermodesulfobacteriota bacterium]|nr:hypothetical protein [Thermodesulfobacteriota bacterium]
MRKLKTVMIILMIALLLGGAGCGVSDSHNDDNPALSTPIQMEIPTGHLQTKVGLSGFIFGAFLLLNAYLLIITSCITLVIKGQAIKKISDTTNMILEMLSVPSKGKGMLSKLIQMLSDDNTRIQLGSAGLIIGIVLAYLGAWIAT